MAARDVSDVARWVQLGTWSRYLWGRYQGRDLYDVFVKIGSPEAMESGCTCPSYKYPCKHALGLLMLATDKRLVPVNEVPPGFVEGCRESRYDNNWE